MKNIYLIHVEIIRKRKKINRGRKSLGKGQAMETYKILIKHYAIIKGAVSKKTNLSEKLQKEICILFLNLLLDNKQSQENTFFMFAFVYTDIEFICMKRETARNETKNRIN